MCSVLGTMKALIASPKMESGTPITAASLIWGKLTELLPPLLH